MYESSHSSTWVIIPAYNEASTIRAVLQSLLATEYQILVINDHSTDETQSIVTSLGIPIITHSKNLGQGAALQTGIDYALSQGAEYIVTFDADGQHSVEDIPKLLYPLTVEDYEVSLGTRFANGGAATNIPNTKMILLKLALLITRILTRLNLTDCHNGLRAFKGGSAPKLKFTLKKMAHASEFIFNIAKHNLRYCEVPVVISYTPYSIHKGRTFQNAIRIIWDLTIWRLGNYSKDGDTHK